MHSYSLVQLKEYTGIFVFVICYRSQSIPMPRKYLLKKEPVDREKLQNCLRVIREEGVSVNAAALQFGIPEATVRRHNNANKFGECVSPIGRVPYVPPDVQSELAVIAKTAARHGFGLTREEVRDLVAGYVQENWDKENVLGMYLRKNCKFVNRVPSLDWVAQFIEDYNLSLQKASLLERSRKDTASNPFIIYNFYSILEEKVKALDIANSPSSFYNVDESAFFLDPQGGKVIAEVGAKTKRVVAGCGRSCFTAMACVCADGTALPPLIIFQAKHLYDQWKGDHPLPGTTFARSGKTNKNPIEILLS
jgi:hypothetical protein